MHGRKLYVGNLSYGVTREDLDALFSAHGEIREIHLVEGKGFGFVEMSNQAEAESAKKELNGREFQGRPLKVDEARAPRGRERRGHRR